MKKNTWFFALLIMASPSVQAISIDWSGTYRFEFVEVDRPSLSEPKERKSYGLNSLNLGAKIIASDGINIVSRFDVFPNTSVAYRNSNMGAQFGGGQPRTPSADADGSRTNTFSQNQEGYGIRASQLYLNINQEFGAFIVGRAPVQFGLGMTYNAGLDPFDHWYSTRDLVGYKFVVDNFYFMPMLAKVFSGDAEQGNDVSDQIFNFEYNNKETGALIGLWHQTRKSSDTSNDTVESASTKFAGTRNGGFSSQTVNFVLGRTWEKFAFKIEASFLTGDTGVITAAGEQIKINAYGIASEFVFPNAESKWDFKMRAGIASGDDPSTAQYEGYQFNRNYDVAILLFNHRLGKKDFLTTNLIKDTTNLGLYNSLDDEAIGNTVYFSPTLNYKWNDKMDLRNTITYATLNVNPTGASDFSKDLGFEWDVELNYRPRDRVQWLNQLAILFPGKAFKNGSDNLDNQTNYGLATKAAISF